MTGKTGDFDHRISEGKWPIFRLTHHRNELKKSDNVVFYLGGKPNKNLLGTAKLSSGLIPEGGGDFSVGLSEVQVWDKPIPMKGMVGSLDFIKNKGNWGIYFQGGVTGLPKKDFEKILTKLKNS